MPLGLCTCYTILSSSFYQSLFHLDNSTNYVWNAHSYAALAGHLTPVVPSVSLSPGTSALHCRDVFAELFLPQPEAGTVSLSLPFQCVAQGL